jgi:general secretion pathway protein G
METFENERHAKMRRRGDTLTVVEFAGRRVALSACGFSLLELVITITVMTILTLGVIPLIKVSVKRQKEQQLREVLRQMRLAVDEFHRDTIGMQCTPGTVGGTARPPVPGTNIIDPRSKVVISDCTIFGVDNPDRYPPDLETLVSGVNVIPRGGTGGMGGQGMESTGTSMSNTNSVLGSQLSTKKKVYLRSIPVNPMTGEKDWDLRSCYDAADSTSWGGENIFDVRFPAKRDRDFKPLKEGDKYSEW